MRALCLIGGLFLVLLVAPSRALEVHQLEIETRRGSYEVDMSFTVAAAPDRVIATLTSYDHTARLNPDVTNIEIVERRGDVTRVRTEFRACALVFCKDLQMLQDVSLSDGRIIADIVPTAGQFSSGRYDWTITETAEEGSLVTFRATVKYEFFVMPVVGKLILGRRLRSQLLVTAENLEIEAAR